MGYWGFPSLGLRFPIRKMRTEGNHRGKKIKHMNCVGHVSCSVNISSLSLLPSLFPSAFLQKGFLTKEMVTLRNLENTYLDSTEANPWVPAKQRTCHLFLCPL